MTDKEAEKTEKFATSCEKCVFAQWENGVQRDVCDLGRLEKFIQMGKTHSHEDGYHVIDTICNTCRNETWANHNLGRNLITKVEEEIQVHLSFVLLSIDDNKDRVVRQLPELVKKCVNQNQIKPKQILVVIRNAEIEYGEIHEILKDMCGDIQYKLIRIVDYSLSKLKCVDLGVQKCTSRYYAIFDLCNSIPKNLIQTINNVINYELQPLSMVKPICGLSGMIIATSLHRIFGGNKEYPIYEKIIEAARAQNSMNHIYGWEDLWKTPE